MSIVSFLNHDLYGVTTLFKNMHIVRNHIIFCWNCPTFDIVEETEQKITNTNTNTNNDNGVIWHSRLYTALQLIIS